MESRLITYQSEEIEGIWPLIEPLIRKVFNKIEDRYTTASLKAMLLKKELQLWTSFDGKLTFCLTHVAIYPRYKILEIFMLGGSGFNWLQFQPVLEKWGKEIGCKSIRIYGRKGWGRKLPDFKIKQFVYEKIL